MQRASVSLESCIEPHHLRHHNDTSRTLALAAADSNERLGLARDDESIQTDRLRLWEDFNNCWLAVLQKQYQATVDAGRAGQVTQPTANLIDAETLRTMGNDLVRLCDIMEKHGLVDYQMGVWEESIIECKMT